MAMNEAQKQLKRIRHTKNKSRQLSFRRTFAVYIAHILAPTPG